MRVSFAHFSELQDIRNSCKLLDVSRTSLVLPIVNLAPDEPRR